MSSQTLSAYFGFLTEPFSKSIDSGNLYISNQLKNLFDKLKFALSRRGIVLITGDVGAGKTTALRAFLERLDRNEYQNVYIENPTLGLRGIFHSMANQLKIEEPFYKWKVIAALKNAIEKNAAEYRKNTLIVIDDAQLLNVQALEELRLFTSFGIDSQSPLTLILLAQPEFKRMIQLKSLQAFAQRIFLRGHLCGLQEDEISAYIKHQLEVAGRNDALFSDSVNREIYQYARGIPRIINALCYECLMETFMQKGNIVDIPILEKVMVNYDMG